MAKKVITFGEIMLRLAPEGYYRFVQADSFGATYGGGEANVAVSLANYGFDAKFVTKLPAHDWRRAHPSVRLRSSMTAPVLLSLPHPRMISTGKKSLTEQNGSTSQASRRH